MRGRRYGTLWRYESREFLASFSVAFLFFFVIFFINQLLLMAEEILSKNAPVGDVVKLVVFSMPAIIAMSFPFGSLVGALMAAGRLSSDNELLVMRASGVSRGAAFVPFAVLGLAFSLVSFTMNDYFLPLGTINYGKLYRKLITSAPELQLRPYSVKRYGDTTIVTGAVEGSVLRDVLIIDEANDGSSRVISAGRAELLDRDREAGVISLVLDDVFLQETDAARPDRFEYSRAARMEYNILLAGFADFTPGVGPKEMSSADVLAVIRAKEAALDERRLARAVEYEAKRAELLSAYLERVKMGIPAQNAAATLRAPAASLAALAARTLRDRSLEIYRLEYYKKFSIPAGALCFVFLAFPLGALARRSGKAVGFGIGLLVAVVYWGMLIGGQTLGLRAELPPFAAMWAPNLMVLAAGLPLLLARRAA